MAGVPSRYQIELENAGNSQQKTTKPPAVKANSLSSREQGALLFTAESQAQETGIMCGLLLQSTSMLCMQN